MRSSSIQLQFIILPYNNLNILVFNFTRVLCIERARKTENVEEELVIKLKIVFQCFTVKK